MKLIPLSGKRGKDLFAQVDDDDYEFLNQWTWHISISSTNYAVRKAKKHELNGRKLRVISMHRTIMKMEDNKLHCDHIDHNGLNNQKSNLRPCTFSQNMKNRKAHGRSKYLGVNFNLVKSGNRKKTYNKWIVRIMNNEGKRVHVGRYNTEEEAALAYNKAALIYHGEFANLNIIE